MFKFNLLFTVTQIQGQRVYVICLKKPTYSLIDIIVSDPGGRDMNNIIPDYTILIVLSTELLIRHSVVKENHLMRNSKVLLIYIYYRRHTLFGNVLERMQYYY